MPREIVYKLFSYKVLFFTFHFRAAGRGLEGGPDLVSGHAQQPEASRAGRVNNVRTTRSHLQQILEIHNWNVTSNIPQ